eukprot:TRINITY_DN3238_c2_g1_i1.p1 TRINITY_DN3238_c2_g1~~TRINITY_DN3238_c2_g1_i1.p1  ORF type:complete len:190 (+),score=52.84 TRINITY_DN3238_c2_g1_i1:33-572(+)
MGFRVVVVGGGGVGKSAMTIQYVNQKFVAEYDPTIEDSYRKQTTVDGQDAVLDILDTAGQEEYKTIQDQWWREGRGFVCVYSVTSRSSFEEVSGLREKILRVKDVDKTPMVLSGNKVDMEDDRQVPTVEGKELAKEWDCPFIECSAKTNKNIDMVFAEIIREIRTHEGIVPSKKKCVIL